MQPFKILTAITIILISISASAGNAWSNYHWARNTHSFTLKVINSTTAIWDTELHNSLTAWSQSNSIDLIITSSDKNSQIRNLCTMVTGKMRVCNATYGQNGWLGLASINLDHNGHISQGSVKLNDSYVSSWTPERKNHVMCQEIGHVFGSDYSNKKGANQKTCMDYSQDVNSQWPNSHDYQMLSEMYSHFDEYNSYQDSDNNTSDCKNASKECDPTKGSHEFGLGYKVYSSEKYEVWLHVEEDGTLTVHHAYLVH